MKEKREMSPFTLGLTLGLVGLTLLAQRIHAGPVTAGYWSGCFQTVYVADPVSGMVRKIERRETEQTANGKPGTGLYGPWQEYNVQRPQAVIYQNGKPRPVTPAEVRRLLGPEVAGWFEKYRQAEISQTFDLTPFRFPILGARGVVPNRQTVPAIRSGIRQHLPPQIE